MPFLTGFWYFIIMVGIIFAAYITSRWLAVRANNMAQGKYIKLIDRVALGKDKGILIVAVGDKRYLMAETPQGLSVINEINAEDLPIIENQSTNMSFKDIMNSYLGLPKSEDNIDPSFNTLSDLKIKISDSLNRMVNKHKGANK